MLCLWVGSLTYSSFLTSAIAEIEVGIGVIGGTGCS